MQTRTRDIFSSKQYLCDKRIWTLSEQEKQVLFGILYDCIDDWDCDNYIDDMSDGPHWQFKVCTKGSCLRTISGTTTSPPHGEEIKKIIVDIVGEENCYFYR